MPAPVGGLNVCDAINLMPKNDAIELVNWIAQQYGVRSRKGYKEWAINFPAEVRTIMEYAPARASIVDYKMFAVTDAHIYDITGSTNAPVSAFALPNTDQYGRFTWVNAANIAGNFLLACSNNGGYHKYDAVGGWVTITMGGGANQVSGVDPNNLIFVTSWKGRQWFIEKGTTKAWYTAPNAITGALTAFDFGPLMKKGGVLSFIASWTIDAGTGVDDYLVLGGENGDILIYKGTDPSSAATFGQVGNWYVGRLPVGHRGFVQYGGDLLILSSAGIQPLSYVTRGGQSLFRVSSVDYLRKIQPLFSDILAAGLDQYGWEICLSLDENLVILQQPTATTSYEQYALYTNENTWSKFRGMPMSSMFAGSQGFFFATPDNKVCQGLTGFFDAVPYGQTVGNGIVGVIQPSYNYFGRPGQNKQWHMIRPTFLAVDKPAVTVTMLADFQQDVVPSTPIYGASQGAKWDVSLWDQAYWAGSMRQYSSWVGAAALGYAGSAILTTVVAGDTYLVSIDYTWEAGGVV
jgi:hypothetical protein